MRGWKWTDDMVLVDLVVCIEVDKKYMRKG